METRSSNQAKSNQVGTQTEVQTKSTNQTKPNPVGTEPEVQGPQNEFCITN